MTGERPYPPLEGYGFLGDGATGALVSRDGSIDWCCLPRLDSGSAFGRLLDWRRGGHCRIAPVSAWEASREYVGRSLVLETAFRCEGGRTVLRDAVVREASAPGGPQPSIVRLVECSEGTVELDVRVEPRFDYGEVRPWLRRHAPGLLTALGGDDALVVSAGFALEADDGHGIGARVALRAGERAHLVLAFRRPETVDPGPPAAWSEADAQQAVAEQLDDWDAWASGATTQDHWLLRSAAVLRGLQHPDTGALAAAGTTSLPEAPGAGRNWDYRYCWVRDSAFAARSLAEIGFVDEADAVGRFVARSSAGHGDELQVAYGVGGERRLVEQQLESLEGWRGSAPVRIGNGAADQFQLDTIGELVNLTWRWHERGNTPDEDQWRFLCSLVDRAAERWQEPDHGIWELRVGPRHLVHSKAMCWVALDRGIRLAEEVGHEAPVERWAAARAKVREAIEREGFDSRRNTYVQAFGGRDLDAALLLLPIAGYVEFEDERMVGTVDAVRAELDAGGGGLLYRYRCDDGVEGEEGAFLACTFWLAECLARQGRDDEARAAFDAGRAGANDLGLFSEQLDPATGEMLGNLPQALTHLSHIAAGVALGL